MTRWVLGFAFRRYGDDDAPPFVYLIRKNRPDWQEGRWNGVGGKIEPGDTSPRSAMSREFEEETGVSVEPDRWKWLGNVKVESGEVMCFTTDLEPDERPTTTTDEPVAGFVASNLPRSVIPTASLYIALGRLERELSQPVNVSLDALP